jgi:hypothetical protein
MSKQLAKSTCPQRIDFSLLASIGITLPVQAFSLFEEN